MTRRLSSADFLLAACCFVWGTNFVVVKSALVDFHPLAFNGIRFALGAALLLFMQWRHEGLGVLRPVLGPVIAIGLIGNLGYQLQFIYGLDRTGAAQASLFTATTPLWVLALARATGHDRFGGRVVAGLLMGIAGVTLLLSESFNGDAAAPGFLTGNLLLLGASASWAVYTVYSQPLLERLRPLALTSAAMTAGALPLLLLGLPEIIAIRAEDVSAASWAGLLYSSLIAVGFGYVAWSHGVQSIGSTRTSLYVNLIPVVATASAWVWLDERLSPRQLLGAAAVIGGIVLSRKLRQGGDQ